MVSKSDQDAERWWQGLTAEQQRELRVRLVRIPGVEPYVEPVDDDDTAGKRDLFEYVLNHEDTPFFLEDPPPFHICRAHARARQALMRGRIEADFVCPFERKGCPMRAIVRAAGGAVEVRLPTVP